MIDDQTSLSTKAHALVSMKSHVKSQTVAASNSGETRRACRATSPNRGILRVRRLPKFSRKTVRKTWRTTHRHRVRWCLAPVIFARVEILHPWILGSDRGYISVIMNALGTVEISRGTSCNLNCASSLRVIRTHLIIRNGVACAVPRLRA